MGTVIANSGLQYQSVKIFVINKLLHAFICFFFFADAPAQSLQANSSTYKTALGVKVWGGGGISFKQFVSDRNAVELVGYFWNRGSRITGLYKIYGPISGATGLQ
ncbi:MAG: hypothetical protein NTW29_13770 [Bacteroidetes bacterium]|nr:hypothetical protein [Bacteroidota bacterium]